MTTVINDSSNKEIHIYHYFTHFDVGQGFIWVAKKHLFLIYKHAVKLQILCMCVFISPATKVVNKKYVLLFRWRQRRQQLLSFLQKSVWNKLFAIDQSYYLLLSDHISLRTVLRPCRLGHGPVSLNKLARSFLLK